MNNGESLITMTKTLILPDLHTRFDIAEQVIDEVEHDSIIFLGDYFDNFDDSPKVAHHTALWLKDSLKKQNRIHLIGNHDISYMTNGRHPCSGWDGLKQMYVNRVEIDWSQLKPYCWVDYWLCTHSGLTNEFYNACNVEHLSTESFLQYMIDRNSDRLMDCSNYRGGIDAHSGIFWCDYSEFKDVPNLNQIFGHTVGPVRRLENKDINSEHICLDTALHHYAIHEDGKIKVFKIPGRE